jgi:hypothetical protein
MRTHVRRFLLTQPRASGAFSLRGQLAISTGRPILAGMPPEYLTKKLTRPRLMMRKRMVKLFVIAVVVVTLALVCVAIF